MRAWARCSTRSPTIRPSSGGGCCRFWAELLALAVVGVGAARLASRNHDLCRGAERKLAGVWDPQVRADLERAFAATGLAAAPRIAATVAGMLDDYAGRWAAMHTDACEATRLRSEQPESVMNLRMSCLDSRLHELRDAHRNVPQRRRAAGSKVDRRHQLALSSIQRCGDLAALTAPVPPPTDAAARAKVEALRKQMAELKALGEAGRLKKESAAGRRAGARRTRDRLRPAAEPIPGAQGPAARGSGQAQGRRAAPVRGLYHRLRGARRRRGRRRRGRPGGAARLLAGTRGRRPPLGRDRAGRPFIAWAATTRSRRGCGRTPPASTYQQGDAKRAIVDAERALALGQKAFGSDSPRLALIRGTLATAYQMQKRYDEALDREPARHRHPRQGLRSGASAHRRHPHQHGQRRHRAEALRCRRGLSPTGVGDGGEDRGAGASHHRHHPGQPRRHARSRRRSTPRRCRSISARSRSPARPSTRKARTPFTPLFGLGSCQLGLGHVRKAVQLLERGNALGQKIDHRSAGDARPARLPSGARCGTRAAIGRAP